MPYLSLTTNQSLSTDERRRLLPLLSAAATEATGKPEQYVMVELRSNPDMLFAGSDAPLAHLQLDSIAMLEDHTGGLVRLLTEFASENLGVPSERVFVELHNVQRHMWGWKGVPFGRRDGNSY